jgi:biopolymer transport protein ExbB
MTQVISVIVKGGVVMIPLIVCSLISLALTIERILFWSKLKSREVLHGI